MLIWQRWKRHSNDDVYGPSMAFCNRIGRLALPCQPVTSSDPSPLTLKPPIKSSHTDTHTHTRKQFVYWCGWFNAITATLSRRRFFFIGNSRRMLEPLRQQSLLIFPSRLINTNKIALDLSDLTVLWGGEEGGRREGGGREVGGWSIGNGDISRWLFLIEFHLELIEIDSD